MKKEQQEGGAAPKKEALGGIAGKFGPVKEKSSASKGKRRKNGKGGKWIVLAVLVLAAVIVGALFFQRRSRQANAPASENGGHTATVTRGDLTSKLSSSGTIAAKNTYNITSLVEGEVLSADFEEGDQVIEGQVLYQIDASSMESKLKSANTALERAKTAYANAQEDYQEALADYSGGTYKSTRTGYIKDLSIQAGDKVSTNTDLAAIYNDTTMKIRVPFLSNEAAAIGVGSAATVTLNDTGEQLGGVVTAVANLDEVLDGGRMVRYVTVEVANPGGLSDNLKATVMVGEFTCSAEGTFAASTDNTMKAELGGNNTVEVAAMLVNEGDYVTVGTPIFRMDAGDAEDLVQSYKDALDQAEESMETAQSNLDGTQESYDNYTITAPISGEVITKNVKAGDNIDRSSSSTTNTLAVIYDLSELTFEMSIDELDISDVKVGQKVAVTADAFEDETYTGTVTNVSLESTYSNGVTNYPVTVTLDDPKDLLPGMNVDGVITLSESKDTLMVPIGALMRGNRVYVKDDTATEQQGPVPAGFRAVEVEVGISNDDYVEILSGVSEGDTVYVEETAGNGGFSFQMAVPMGGGPGGPGSGPGGRR